MNALSGGMKKLGVAAKNPCKRIKKNWGYKVKDKDAFLVQKLERICLELDKLAETNIFYYGSLRKEGYYLLKKVRTMPSGWASNAKIYLFADVNFAVKNTADSIRKFLMGIKEAIKGSSLKKSHSESNELPFAN